MSGVTVTGPVDTTDPSDTYPTHKDNLGLGGYRPVADQAARLAIPADRRKIGMWVKQLDTGDTWTLSGGIADANWVVESFGQPVPTGPVPVFVDDFQRISWDSTTGYVYWQPIIPATGSISMVSGSRGGVARFRASVLADDATLLNNDGVKFTSLQDFVSFYCRAGVHQLTDTRVGIGIYDIEDSSGHLPYTNDAILLYYDPTVSVNWLIRCVSSATVKDYNTGVLVVLDHLIQVKWIPDGAGNIKVYIHSGAGFALVATLLAADLPSTTTMLQPVIAVYCKIAGPVNKDLYVDDYELYNARNQGSGLS